jgi:hypothetical protein
MHVLRVEDVMAQPKQVLGDLCAALGLEASDALAAPSWNGEPLQEVYPWGTIRSATPEANRATAAELSEDEGAQIREDAGLYLSPFGYDEFVPAR